MKLWRRGNKDPNPIIARNPTGEIPVTKYYLPKEPEVVTNSWVVGHSCFFYHGMDWVHLNEFWRRYPITLFMN